jgi:cytochrome P450
LSTTIGASIAAGSDTTAVTLSAVIYYLLKNPPALKKLRAEIDEFAGEGKISNPITYQESQKMPYLQAVIKEGLRVHPAVGQMMARTVPPKIAVLAGTFFPGGVGGPPKMQASQ